jgi:hypothetical protein
LPVLPQYRRTLQEQEILAAEAAGVDARWSRSIIPIIAELCAHERDWPFR